MSLEAGVSRLFLLKGRWRATPASKPPLLDGFVDVLRRRVERFE
jgi:hypothetical protein